MDDNGRYTEQDEEGKIRQAALSSERARAMAQARWAKTQTDKADAEQVLKYLGWDNTNPAPAHVRVIAQQFCSAKNPGSALALIDRLFHESGRSAEVEKFRKPKVGENCPLCGQHFGTYAITGAKLDRLLEALGGNVIEGELVDDGTGPVEQDTGDILRPWLRNS